MPNFLPKKMPKKKHTKIKIILKYKKNIKL